MTVNVYLDDRLIYACRDWWQRGNATLTVSTLFEIQRVDEGMHEVKIALAFAVAGEPDIPALARQLAALENHVRQIEEGFNNEITVEEAVDGSLAEMVGTIIPHAE